MPSPPAAASGALAGLSKPGAEGLARRIIAAEAASAGVGADSIRSSGGGVDVRVEGAPRESGGGLIKRGLTAYRIVPGGFAPSRDAPRLLLGGDGRPLGGVQRCLDDGGTLVVVLMGWDGTDAGAAEVGRALAGPLRGGLRTRAGARIEVWGQGRIMGALGRHPHLAPPAAASGWPAGILTHAEWSSLPDMGGAFHAGPEQLRFVDELRGYLGADGRPVLVQVSGEPGSGKTRLVLEATRGGAHGGRVAYTSRPRSLRPVLDRIALGGAGPSGLVVVVLDDCTWAEHAAVWHEAQNYSGVKVVAISAEPGADGIDECHMPVPGLGGDQIGRIISGHAGEVPNLEEWIAWCGTSPRAARIAGASLAGGRAGRPESAPVWDAHVAGPGGRGAEGAEARRAALGWLSLFKAVRLSRPCERELGCVADLAGERDGIGREQFMCAVEGLRSAGALRGESELRITPKALHLHAWEGWWAEHGAGAAPETGRLYGEGSPRLLQSYIDMFGYAGGSPGAARIAGSLLALGGALGAGGAAGGRQGADLLAALGELDPPSALSCIERAAAGAGGPGALPDRLVPALARILRDPGSFPGAMRLLLGIAASREGESPGGRPSGPALDAYCAALDPAGPDRAARGVPLAARLAAIEEAMRSGQAGAGLVAARACGSVLAMRRASIAVPCHEGAGHVPDPWSPDDRGGAVAYYLGILDALGGAALGPAGGAAGAEAARQAVEALRQAAIVPEMAGPAVGLAERLLAAGAVPDKGRLLAQVAVLLDIERDRMDAGIAARLAALRDSVEGSGFSAELRRLVGGPARLGWRDPYREHAERVRRGLRRLAGEAARRGLPGPDMEWLVTRPAGGSEPEYAFEFGLEVGAADARGRMHAAAAAAMRGAAAAAAPRFLGGCLRAMRDGGAGGQVEDALDAALADGALCGHLPELTHMAGASDRGARRLARGVSEGRIGPESLGALCSDGALAGGASGGALAELVDAVLGARGLDPAAAGAAALGLVHAYYLHGGGGEGGEGGARPIPLRPALDALLNGGLLGARGDELGGRAAGWWTALCIALARQHPGQAARLAAAAIDRLGRPRLQPRYRDGDSLLDVVAEAARLRPREAWGAVSARLAAEGERGAAARALCEWMGRGGGARLLPMADVIRWAEEEPDSRPELLSHCLPPDFAVARSFVARFGGLDHVADNVSEAFLRGEHTGSILSHYAGRRAQAMRMYDGEDDPAVLAWIDRHVARIDERIAELAPEAGRLAA